MSEGATAHGSTYKIYWVTWGILLVITVAMLAAEKFHLPRVFLVLFLVVFMLVKATMITGNFMHLRYEQRNLAFIVALGLLVTSAILFSFLLESIFLSLFGGAIGAIASMAMGFVRISTMNFATWSEIVFALFDAVAPKHVVEVGAFHGKGTRDMLDWTRRAGATGRDGRNPGQGDGRGQGGRLAMGRGRRTARTAEYVGGSGKACRTSETLASPRA